MWLTRTTETPEFFREWEIAAKARRTPSGYLTAEGLFSADGPDPASELLAAEFGPGLKGQAADLGAGWGYLSAEILKQAPKIEALHLIESDHRAVELARKNVSDDRAEYHWADATRPGELPNGMDLVVTNPPFHQGRATEPGLGQAFLKTAAALLKPKGKLLLVANRHLPYEATLRELFRNVATRVETGQFKVIEATRPQTRRR